MNYVKTNLETPAANQTDCPRFTETRNWVENFNLNNQNVAQETVVTNSIQTNQRWTWTNWTQDNTNLNYILNPRVIESKVGDTTNIKRSTTEYRTYPNTTIAEYGLVNNVKVYDADQTTILKQAETDYNFSSSYISRRIIGLPAEVRAYGRENGALNLVSKVGYAYDEGNFTDATLEQNPANIVQHDNANYGASFVIGRANPTSTTRYDVTGQTASVTSHVKYNTAGGAVAQIDPLGRTVKMSYADAFNDNLNRNSFAYPTKVYDPANNYSEVKYRFDTGANVWAKSPAPVGNTTGKETVRLYDSFGRLERETLVNTGAYTRYEYPTNQVQSKVFSTVIDTNNNGADAADEVLAESWTDGAGRVRRSRTEHPNSTGGWTGTLTEYDILGQVKRATVPTEINSNYEPAGDDAARGWLWTQQEYDWKGRTTRTINTDGTDTLASYEGCGCAGGEIVTIKGEEIIETDWQGNNPNNLGRRTQKVYSDILGRAYKSEILNWNGTIYSSSTTTFDGYDRPLTTINFKGTADLNNEHQIITMIYDGHGRLKTLHRPEQDVNAVTTYNYNVDDSISSVMDARGATETRSYNSRGLLEQITYSVPPGSNILVTPTTTFSYDAVGNRTQMTDQTGSTTYAYDSISRMISETKQFNGQNQSPTQSFTISYQYHLTGALKSITEPSGQRTDYANDKIGRLQEVTGTSFAGHPTVPSQLNNIKYRAWGAVKSMDYGSGATLNQTFDNRLRISNYKVSANPQLPTWQQEIMTKQYNYYQDGRIRYVKDGNPELSPDGTQFDRSYKYDHLGRITTALSGDEARGQTPTNYRPYRQNFSYDVWGNVTSRQTRHWSKEINETHVYQNNRESSWAYDADGRILNSHAQNAYGTEYLQYVYDASGQAVSTRKEAPEDDGNGSINIIVRNNSLWTDGDGRVVGQRVVKSLGTYPPVTEYQGFSIYSSVLGSVVREVGWDHKVLVYAFGSVLAYHELSDTSLNWVHRDPGNISYKTTHKGIYGETSGRVGAELDPAGANVGNIDPYQQNNNNLVGDDSGWGYPGLGSPLRIGCRMDGMDFSCSQTMRFLGAGIAVNAPWSLSIQETTYNGEKVWSHFRAYGDGYAGYVPSNGAYAGRGLITPAGRSVKGKLRQQDTNFSELNGANNESDLRRVSIFTPPRFFQIRRRIKDFEAEALKSSITAALNITGECRTYITDLINKAAANAGVTDRNKIVTNIEDLFDQVMNSRGPSYIPDKGGIFIKDYGGSHNAVNEWAWANGPGSAEIHLKFIRNLPSNFNSLGWMDRDMARFNSVRNEVYNLESAMATVHELIHVSIKAWQAGTDYNFARAAADLAGEEIEENQSIDWYSSYWDQRLRQACGFKAVNGLNSGQFTHHKLYK